MPRKEDEAFSRVERLALEMDRHGSDREAPVRSIMALLGDRWTTLVLQVLALGEWRHAELRRTLARLSSEQDISQRVLTLKLRALEREGLVVRVVTDDVPPKVSYQLSQMGRALHSQVHDLICWIERNGPAILAARGQYDRSAD